MKKVIIFSDLFLTTFPFLEIPLYNELKNNGIDTNFILQDKDYRLLTPELSKVFSPIVTTVQNPKKDLLDIAGKDDICILRFGYKGLIGDVFSSLRANKRRILALDPAAVDIKHRMCEAQFVAVKSEWMKKQIMKKFPGVYKKIFTTGTIHFDNAFNTKCDRSEFMKSYGLNPSKKLAILTPANPAEATYQIGVDNDYKKICDLVKNKCPNYELMIKGHPMDYTASLPALPGIIHKREYYKDKHSWEVFAPNAKIIKADEGYKAFSVADVVLNVRSSIAMETPMFPVPLININRNKYLTNWPSSSNEGVMKDIKLEELEDTLNNNKYFVNNNACKEYVLKYSDPYADGKSYKRITNLIINGEI